VFGVRKAASDRRYESDECSLGLQGRGLIGRGKMKDLEWKDEYLLGIPELDRQHKRIFDCFVIVADALGKHDRWLADSSIVQLVALLQTHCEVEESVMRILGYPELERHIEEHLQFHAQLHGLAQDSLKMKGNLSREMINAAQKWLREHITTSDKHYAAYFSVALLKSIGKKRRAK
jgi:hemerythrin